jgi:drug/metabolite transporter (DMT)-like permease
MSPTSLALVTMAAIMHAFYHLLYKHSVDKQAFAWWILFVASLLTGAVAILTKAWAALPLAPPILWLVVGASCLCEVAYYVLMGRAYVHGDLSLAYPLARGTAPLLTVLWAVVFLRESITWIGVLGIVLAIAGLSLLNLGQGYTLHTLHGSQSALAVRFALLTALAISGYTTLDKVGVAYLAPHGYIGLIFIGTTLLFLCALVATGRTGRLLHQWQCEPTQVIVAAFLMSTGYFLVLTAMQMSPVAYVGPAREMSVVFAAALGAIALKEPYGWRRVLASVIVLAGVLLLGVARP